MKLAYLVLALVSLAFMGFSWIYGQKMNDLGDKLWSNSDNRSRIEQDIAFAAFERDRSNLHLVVKAVSAVYFLGAAAVFAMGGKQAAGKGWKITLWVSVAISIVMLLWSLMLSGAISFDDVFPAWLAAAGLFLIVSVLRSMATPPEPMAG